MPPEIEAPPSRAAAAARPHRALRVVAGCGAAIAAVEIMLTLGTVVSNWRNVPLDSVPWLLLAMLGSMLALLWSGIVLMRRPSDIGLVVFMTSALLGLPFTLFGLVIAFSD